MTTPKIELNALAAAIQRHAPADDVSDTAVSALSLSQFSAPTELTAILYEPCLCVVAQGAKEVQLSGEKFRLDPAQMLMVSVDLAVDARVAEASRSKPYLGMRITLDPAVVGELIAEGTSPQPPSSPSRGLAITPVEPALLNAVTRLVGLLDSPQDVGPLAPLTLREITYRLLSGPEGWRLRQIASADAPTRRIANALQWIKQHFSQPLRVEELAQRVKMSSSAFHLHFKNVTAMTPLQYQKRLRLHEARRLMLRDGLDAAEAAFRVGYESPSQFSREYRRMFQAPPRKNVAALMGGTD